MIKTAKKQGRLTETRQRFSIRKLTIGAASVMIGLTFMFVSGQCASAAETTPTDTAVTTAAATDNSSASESVSTTANSNSEQASDSTQQETAQNSTEESATQAQNSSLTTEASASANTSTSNPEASNSTGTTTQTSSASDQNTSEETTTDSNVSSTGTAAETAKSAATETSKYNTADWDGTLDDSTHEYTLTKYTGTDTENVYIPNTQDFIDAGTISSDDKVYITNDLLQTITNAGAVNVAIDGAGEKNKVYAKGDLSSAMASSSTLKSVDLSNLDTSEVTNANHMFFHDTALESADLSGWNLNNASNLSYMFLDDDNLKSLNISNWQLKDGVNTTFAFGYRDNLSSLTDFNVNGVKNLNKNVLKTYLNVVKKNGATSVDLSSATLSSSVTDLQLAFANLPNVKSINLSGWDTSHVTNVYAAFAFDSALTDVNLSGWNLSGTDSIKSLFYQDSNLTNVDLSNVDFGTNLTDETYAFQGASSKLANVNLKGAKNVPESVLKAYVTAAKNSKATSLDLSNVSLSDKITSFRSLFQNLSSLQTINLTGWKTSKITDMSYMFYNDQNLKEIKGLDTWDTSNVTDMSRMFYNDQNLKEIKGIDGWKTGSVTDMSYMFANNYSLKELNLSKWDVSKVGTKNDSKNFSLACMFADDFSLTSVGDIYNWHTENVHSTRNMFYGTMSLKKIDLSGWKTSNLQIAGDMFQGTGASEINLSGWDFSHLTRFNEDGTVNVNGQYRGGQCMFADLGNKAVITMNNVTLPDTANAFVVTDFKGDQPIVVLSNNGSALTALNSQTWTDEKGNTVTGRQNSNFVTYVDAAGNELKTSPLNFVYTDAASLKSALAKIASDDKAVLDTQKNATSSIKLLDPSENDSFLADFMTSKYQLTYEQKGNQGGSTDPDNPNSGSTIDPSDPAEVDPTDPDQTDNLKPKLETPDQEDSDSEQSTDSSQNNATNSGQGQTMPSGVSVNVKSEGTKTQQFSANSLSTKNADQTSQTAASAQAKQTQALPQTGADDHNAELWGLALLSMLGLGAYIDRKRRHN